MSLIETLQEKISTKQTRTSEVLETAIIIGKNENDQTLIDWATQELNGYKNIYPPNYRAISIYPKIEQWESDKCLATYFMTPHILEYVCLGAIKLEKRIHMNDFVLSRYSNNINPIKQITLMETTKEVLETILYDIQQETLSRIKKLNNNVTQKDNNNMTQKQNHNSNSYHININTGDNANIQGIGHDNVIHNYVTNEQKIDLQNQLNQLQELIKEYQENSDYEYVKDEISHIQKQLEHPPIEHKKIVGLFQYIPNLISGLCAGTASATASHYIFPLLTAISQNLGC